MKSIVLDNSVLTDILIEKEERSDIAFKAYKIIKNMNMEIYLPCFALFEIKSALSNKLKNRGKITLRKVINENDSLRFKYFPIDNKFVAKHMGSKIGYLKAADYIYVCLANQEDAILITEDEKQYNVSKEAGIETYKIEEFIENMTG